MKNNQTLYTIDHSSSGSYRSQEAETNWGPKFSGMRKGSTELRRPADAIKVFDRLFHRWISETAFSSSSTEPYMHPAYQQIIGLGQMALPLIFARLEPITARRWHWALYSITRYEIDSNEISSGEELCDLWLEWGRQNEYI